MLAKLKFSHCGPSGRWARPAAAAMAVAAALAVGAPAFGAFPGKAGNITFVQLKSGERTIQDRRPDGSTDLVAFGKNGGFLDPSWSPSGRFLAFGVHGANFSRIAIVREGGALEQLVPQPQVDSGRVRDSEPAWAPKGYKVAFTRYVESGPKSVPVNEARAASLAVPNLYTWTPKGTRQLTSKGGNEAAWSVRNHIVFVRSGDLHRMRSNGKAVKRLTKSGGSAPNWSPKGSSIVFVRKGELNRMRGDGKHLKKLTSAGGHDPVWSTDGKRIIYGDGGRIYSIPSTGGKRSLLVSVSGGTAASPDEQPLPETPGSGDGIFIR